jgi:hypothetical protein
VRATRALADRMSARMTLAFAGGACGGDLRFAEGRAGAVCAARVTIWLVYRWLDLQLLQVIRKYANLSVMAVPGGAYSDTC